MSGQHAHVHAGPGEHRGRGRPDRLDRQSRCSIATGPMYWGLAQLRGSFDFVQVNLHAEKDLATGPIALGWRQSLPYLRRE